MNPPLSAPGEAGDAPAGAARRDPVTPSAEQVALLIEVAGRRGPFAARNRALVAVFASCGLRVGEALALSLADISPSEATITVRGGTAPRTVELSPACRDAAEAWLAERAALPGDALFVTRRGTPLTASYVRQVLPRLARAAGLPGAIGPEALRRAHARDLGERGWPLADIRRRLGYRTPGAARRFLRGAGLVAPAARGAQEALRAVPRRDASPCRSCLYGDALDTPAGRGIVEDGLEAVIAADREGVIRDANRTAEIVLGAGSGTLVGTSLWDLFAGPRHERLAEACRACLATGRASWVVDAGTGGEGQSLARVVPTSRGVAIWIRDDLALSGMSDLARQLASLAHGGAASSVLVLRAVRGDDEAISDFVVAAVHAVQDAPLIAHPDRALHRRVSEILSPELFDGFRAHLAEAVTTRSARRVRVALRRRDAGATSVHCWIVRLAGDWVAVAMRSQQAAA